MFNNFQNTLIRNFDSSFPVIMTGNRHKSANWITKGIKNHVIGKESYTY